MLVQNCFWRISAIVAVVLCCSQRANADQVIADDLIVQGSIAVGFDAVNGENFGFDTIRLKENNLRVKFQDTSTSASFPTQDWQLTANATTNGGGNFFSIDAIDPVNSVPFKVETAPTNSFFLKSNGNLGLGTGSPVVDVHVVSGNTPTLRLEQDGSSGFTPQTWDVAGNEANFFIRDATNGSKLPFRITPNTPGDAIRMFTDRIAINNGAGNYDTQIKGDTNANLIFADASADNVGIRTATPNTRLHVNTDLGSIATSGATPNGILTLSADNTTLIMNAGVVGGAGSHAWLQSRLSGAATFNNLALNPRGGNVGIGTTTPAGTLDVNGTIFLSGVQQHPDYVFENDYELESIDDHTAYMFTHKHLPAVGKGVHDESGRSVMELGQKTLGTLEELEKAHIYIDQLHKRLKNAEKQTSDLADRLARIEGTTESNE